MKKLSKKRELQLFDIITKSDSNKEKKAAREELILANEWLVSFAIHKWYRNIPKFLYEDMKQVGLIGVNTAIDKFDLSKEVRFATYATWWIRQHINQFLVDSGRTVRAPAYVIDAASKILKAREEFELEHDRLATNEEIAKIVELPVEKISQYENAVLQCASLEFDVGDDTQLMDLIKDDSIEDPAESYLKKDTKNELSLVLSKILLPREEFVIRSRFGLGMNDEQTLEAVGDRLDLTKERIRQIEKNALNKLQKSDLLKYFVDEHFGSKS